MKRTPRWRWWLASVLVGRRPRTHRYAFRIGTPVWKRWWFRFRPPPAPPTRPVPRMPWLTPPDDELGMGLPAQLKIATGTEAVVVLTGCVAYSSGFFLGIGIRRRHEPKPRSYPGAFPPQHPDEPDEMSLEIAIRYSDGRATSRSHRGSSDEVSSWYRAWSEGQDPPAPAGPIIGPGGGGGGGRRWDMRYWVWPLPPDGPVTITCRWPAGGVSEGSVELDGSAIRRACQSSEKLWNDA